MSRNVTAVKRSPPTRFLPIALLVTVTVALLVVPVRNMFLKSVQKQGGRELVQQVLIQDVEQLGGHVAITPTGLLGGSRSLVAVDLSSATIDSDLIQRLSEFTTIERLDLSGARLASEGYLAIGRMTGLRSLSLSWVNIF